MSTSGRRARRAALCVSLIGVAKALSGQSPASWQLSGGPAADGDSATPPRVCTVDPLTATFPRRWLGTRIGRISVVARNVETPTAALDPAVQFFHRPTLLGVAEEELRVVSGAPMDSLQLLETVRRMRATPLYTDVTVEGSQCGTAGETDLTFTTRDRWSLRGGIRLADGGGPARFSFGESNIFGTGRSISLAQEDVDGRRATSASIADPYLFGTRFRGAATFRTYGDGRAWIWSVRTQDWSPRDEWRAAFTSRQLRRYSVDDPTQPSIDILRRDDALTLSRLVLTQSDAVYAVVFGGEHQTANLAVYRTGPMLGTPDVRREFTAPVVGLARRSTKYATVDWLVPGQAEAELSVGIEGELVAGVGRETTANATITHVDGWIGATTMPSSGTILTADAWTSGYWGHDSLSNGSLRLVGVLYQRAARGFWVFRASSDRLYNPDPDVFALATIDPMLRTLAPLSRLAESALSVSAERSLHLYSREGRWAVDGALFAGYSERHRSVDGTLESLPDAQAVTFGIGLREIRSQPNEAPLRLDIGHAVWRSRGLPSRWMVSLSTALWINSGRVRDGAREPR